MIRKIGPVKGYKCFDMNLKCRGFQFEVGKSYEHDGQIELCKSGFHFHENSKHLFNYYNKHRSRVCEVIAQDVITDDEKSVCKKIEIIKEISYLEALSICLCDGYGYGLRDGDGYGFGDGLRDGYGYGFGYGEGFGDGYGEGFGDGYGYGEGFRDRFRDSFREVNFIFGITYIGKTA